MIRILSAILVGLLADGWGFQSRIAAQSESKAKNTAPDALRSFELPKDEVVLRVAFSPDGRKVIAGTMGGTVWLWDTEKGKDPRKFNATAGELLTGAERLPVFWSTRNGSPIDVG